MYAVLFNGFEADDAEGCREIDCRGNLMGYGGVAQLGEHLPCKQGVRGSIPLISTKVVAGK